MLIDPVFRTLNGVYTRAHPSVTILFTVPTIAGCSIMPNLLTWVELRRWWRFCGFGLFLRCLLLGRLLLRPRLSFRLTILPAVLSVVVVIVLPVSHLALLRFYLNSNALR